MKKVKVLKVYRVRETDAIVSPGDILDYPVDRANELAAGGWIQILGDSEITDEGAALVGVSDDLAPAVDGAEGLQPDEDGDTDLPAADPEKDEQTEPADSPEKVEIPADQQEKAESGEAAPKGKRGRKPKTEK